MVKSLNDLHPEESGIVYEIKGGEGLINRLNALGIQDREKDNKNKLHVVAWSCYYPDRPDESGYRVRYGRQDIC